MTNPPPPFAPPTGTPVSNYPPPPIGTKLPNPQLPKASARSRRTFVTLLVTFTVMAVAAIGLGIWAVVAVVTTVLASPAANFGALTGDPPPPPASAPITATTPTECDEECYSLDDAVPSLVAPEATFAALGLTTIDTAWSDLDVTDAQQDFFATSDDWSKGNIVQPECFFSFYLSPGSTPLHGQAPSTDDLVQYLGQHSDTSSTPHDSLSQSVRVFTTSAAAEQHLGDLTNQIAGCPEYTYAGEANYPIEVTALPALSLPESVAAVGWSETDGDAHYYVVDVQRGNLVVRNILTTTGAISADQFRAFSESTAAALDSLGDPGATPL